MGLGGVEEEGGVGWKGMQARLFMLAVEIITMVPSPSRSQLP